MEYIEARLSNRSSANPTRETPSTSVIATTTAPIATPKQDGGQAVMQGHLMEIDLGDEARDRNVAMTERAQLGDASAADGFEERRVKKPRLGRDGKPWRPRNRRGSDAIKRDQLVEQVLRESRRKFILQPCSPFFY